MRLLTLLTLALITTTSSVCVMAEEANPVPDEFGARFTAEAPSAFGENTAVSGEELFALGEDPAAALANIMPAAGEEEPQDEQQIPNTEDVIEPVTDE